MNLLLFALIFLTLINFVSAQSCNSDQRILRLSDTNNSHGARWDIVGYNVDVCYDDIFGNNYGGANAGSAVHTCNNNNRVLRLSDITNAHAQTPDYTGTVYPVEVCYGDLVCRSVTNGQCLANEQEIVSLSSDNNAQIETEGYQPSNYPIKICCSSASSVPTIFNAKWRYANGQEIATNAFICPNIQILLTVKTTGVPDNTNAYFQIYEDDGALGRDVVGPLWEAPVVNNQATYPLDLSNAGVRAALQGQFNGEPGNELELEFDALVNFANLPRVKSQQIKYVDNANSCNYPKPVASIVAPVHQGVYFANTPINFTSGCTSLRGPVVNEWTVTQGSNTITNASASFLHSFSNGGQVNVRLKCTDLIGKFDVTQVQMLVVASPYAFAYIEKPEFNSFVVNPIPQQGPYFPESVRFSAGDSFVVDVTKSTAPCEVKCLAGDCPAQTQNSSAACGGASLLIIDAPTGNANYDDLAFNWTFWDGDWKEQWTQFEGAGVYTGIVPYDDMSNTVNDKYMSVRVTHTLTGTNAEFQRQFTLGRCLNSGNTYQDTVLGPLSTLAENGLCKAGDGIAGTADDCCPLGLQCFSRSSGEAERCQSRGNIITKCEEFPNKNSCNSNNDTRIPRASYGQDAPVCTTLKCLWDDTGNKCGVNVTTYDRSANGCDPGVIRVSCAYTMGASECINGRRTITYTVISGDASCARNPVSVPCGSLSFELGFFGLREFIISIILIASIYLLLNYCRIKRL